MRWKMERWYVLRTVPEKEEEAAELLERVIDHHLWTYCRILKKTKVFRTGGMLHFLEELMFPGYLFIKTAFPEKLTEELKRARKFPHMIGEVNAVIVPVEATDLEFLQTVCGETLQRVMGVTRIALGADNHIVNAEGILSVYLDRIVKLNLRKRCAIVEVNLFNRQQTVLFGVCLEKDQAG